MFSPKEPLIAHLHSNSNEVCFIDKWATEGIQSKAALMF